MIASSWLPVSVSTRPPSSKPSAPLHPSEDREAGTVEREGVFGRSPVRPSGATSLTSFHPWEARGHFKEGGPDALQGCGTSGGGAGSVTVHSPACWAEASIPPSLRCIMASQSLLLV